MIFVTGGAGFIGSNFIHSWFKKTNEGLLNIDKLTYSGNLDNLSGLEKNKNYHFEQADICNREALVAAFEKYKPRAIINFAAESHVDRSIVAPEDFIHTNLLGTFTLLDVARMYWLKLSAEEKKKFRYLQISTDEVYGSLEESAPAFHEEKKYEPNSPYSASKAGGDHLVRAYYHTYGLPVLTTNCSNNYGPYQYPEKLIPLMILNALSGKKLPVYGDGKNIRDWLYVEDHCLAIMEVLAKGAPGEVYNIGGCNELKNIDVVYHLCTILDKLKPKKGSYKDQIEFVTDRPGHDRRYAINATKIERDIGWTPKETFETGLEKTINWYLTHDEWMAKFLK